MLKFKSDLTDLIDWNLYLLNIHSYQIIKHYAAGESLYSMTQLGIPIYGTVLKINTPTRFHFQFFHTFTI